MKNSKNIPATVSVLLGKKLNKIYVLKFNEKKSKPGNPAVFLQM
jgi:hypothetical protein